MQNAPSIAPKAKKSRRMKDLNKRLEMTDFYVVISCFLVHFVCVIFLCSLIFYVQHPGGLGVSRRHLALRAYETIAKHTIALSTQSRIRRGWLANSSGGVVVYIGAFSTRSCRWVVSFSSSVPSYSWSISSDSSSSFHSFASLVPSSSSLLSPSSWKMFISSKAYSSSTTCSPL